jgi:myo-inositol-1(or 4)-monophosphatase
MTTSISPLKEMIFAVRAASEKVAGDFWRLAQGGGGVEAKGDRNGMPDYVTQTDRAAEGIIQRVLAQVFPSIPFVGEESGGSHEDHRRFFLVDPLDGTSNFVALREYFSVCAAYVEDGEVHAAVVADPMRGHVYSAEKGRGAFLSGLDGRRGSATFC